MVLYLSIIAVAAFLMTLFNSLFNQAMFNSLFNSAFYNCPVISVLLVVIIGIVLEIAIEGLVAFIVHSLPNKWFDKDKKIFKVSKKERKFYDKLHIKSWKDKVWELGVLGGFRKNKVYEPNNPKYLNLFIIENNKGFLGHFWGIFFGFLILLYPHYNYWLCIGLPIAIVDLFLDLLSMMVLRYNIPKLTIAYERAKRANELKKKEQEKLTEKEEKKEQENENK